MVIKAIFTVNWLVYNEGMSKFMKEKKLHIGVPPIVGYLHHAYHLSIAKEHPFFYEWFYSNYIQLKYYPKTRWLNFYCLDLSYKYYPLLDMESINNLTIKTNGIDVIPFVINRIKEGYYVWVFTDEYYDPNRIAYKISHNIHESLIYGYSLNKGCLYTVGFSTQSIYTYTEISFNDFSIAFNSVETNAEVKTLKPNIDIEYEFDIVNVKNLINDYVNSENTSIRNRMFGVPSSNTIYGLNIIKYIKIDFENPIENVTFYDIRPLHIMWEHKKCMTSRIRYLLEKKQINDNSIYENYKEIEKKILLLRNFQIKFKVTNNENFIKKIINSLDEIYNKEAEILVKLLNSIG